jgi:hypothetical protein
MTLPYYVEPEYWESGYAYGDPDVVAAVGSAIATSEARVDLVRLSAISDVASGSAASAAQIVKDTSSQQALLVSASSVAELVRQARLLGAASSSVVANISATKSGAAAAPILASVAARSQRRFVTSAATAISAIIAASARYKWLDEAVTSEIWTQRAAASDTWTPAASDATDWTET